MAGARESLQVNEPKSPQGGIGLTRTPKKTIILQKQVRVLLPFVIKKNKQGQMMSPQNLSENNSNNEENPEVKRKRRELETPEIEATFPKEECSPHKSSLGPQTEQSLGIPGNTKDVLDFSTEMQSNQDGDGDEIETADLDGSTELSAYEKKRLKNISENADFFASLHLVETAARLREMITKRPSHGIKRKKPVKAEDDIVCRRSMRLLKVDPSGVPLPDPSPQPESVVEQNSRLPPGPLEMIPENQNGENEMFKGLLQMWMKISQPRNKSIKKLSSMKRYKASLSGMVINEANICKVTKTRICSLAIHPSETRTLVAAGDKIGQVGLWDLTRQPKEDGVFTFILHSQLVGCLNFSPTNPAHLLSLSYDGTLRCGDFTRAMFEEVYRNEERDFSYFDFLADDASTLIVGHWDAGVAIVDRRTPGTSYEQFFNSNMSLIRTVEVHPMNRHYFIAAGARDVHIYDLRYLKPRGMKPLISLTEHMKSLASAYFSPVTGNRVVTTCADDNLRVFDTSCMVSNIPLLTRIRHNNNTGRWLTRFRANWDPKQEDCFIVGSMARPRSLDIFHESGELVHSFIDEECLASVCSINVMHPTQNILAGGNSSGRIHIFKG
ncbi:WD repeat-containing protein 76 isoform X1 [Monodelphis domestica]|uniref:WD repeat-containing protein 76 isoform X1 n=2 Tax=Monodelphis domestica TaxID=13616 RepID=UPI0024E1C1C2|nr:WD repeat-containing protein 76 isoform X1 [Monodelphis domestica]